MKKIALVMLSMLLIGSSVLAEDSTKDLLITVKSGDSVSKIARQYLDDPAEWRALLKFNKIANPNLVQPGLKLNIPAHLLKKPTAVVVHKSGTSWYAHQASPNWKPVAVKVGLFVDDQVKTDKASTVDLHLGQRGVLKIHPESFIVINKHGDGGKDLIFTLQSGRLQASVEGLKRDNARMTIRTPSAVAAVRGTQFDFAVDEKSGSGLGCYEGKVDIVAAGTKVEVPGGMGTKIEKGKAPMKPFKLPLPPEITVAEIE